MKKNQNAEKEIILKELNATLATAEKGANKYLNDYTEAKKKYDDAVNVINQLKSQIYDIENEK